MEDFVEAHSKITQELLATDTDARIEIVNNRFHITALYGWHFTAEQAHEVVDKVAANSIVLVEGHMNGRDYANRRLYQHLALADQRLRRGTYDSTLSEACETLASEFLHREYSTHTENDLYSYLLYQGLLAKNCVILPADYINLDDHTQQLNNLEASQKKLYSFFPIRSEVVLDQAVELDAELLSLWLDNQVIREEFALNLVLYFLGLYADPVKLETIAKAVDGRSEAYIIYGLAHRDSLHSRFKNLGMPIERVYINSGEIPVEELRNIATELAQSPADRKAMIRNHYLGLIAAQQEDAES